MRAVSLTSGLKVRYPDEVCFAFNPNYMEIEHPAVNTIQVRVAIITYNGSLARSKVINVALYNHTAKVYLSRLFELMFEEPEHTRSIKVKVSIGTSLTETGRVPMYDYECLVLWGGIAPGERFNALGVYSEENGRRHFSRNLVWFRNFPFQVQVFKYNSDVKFQGRYDGGMYGSQFDGARRNCSVSGIDVYSSPTNAGVADIVAESVQRLVFFQNTKQLLAWNGGVWCKKWNSAVVNHFLCLASSDCVEANTNKPLRTVDYIFLDENGLAWKYRFDGEMLVPAGINQNSGFVTLYPNDLFPTATRNATIKYKIAEVTSLYSTFDHSFDYTFFQSGETVALVNLEIRHETAGHYLRWIDTQGNLQFYLFTKGKRSMKTTLGKNSIVSQEPLRGTYFGDMKRITNITLTTTHKCCAVGLPADRFEWISTIITSPIIDLYLGKDADGNEIWVPVTIEAGTVTYDNKEELHDLEITFCTPSHTPQTL